MTEDAIFKEKDFKNCADFHGHICPGLAIGYRAARAGLDWFEEHRSVDEELVAIVETDSCSTDAIQVLTGCTFGKGNLVFKDHGKHVFTLLGRQSGDGVRVSMKPGGITLDKRHNELFQKIKAESASEEDQKEFLELHRQKSLDILKKPLEDLFSIESAQETLPAKAKIEPSEPCEECGEPTMRSKLVNNEGRSVCKDCLSKK